MEPTAIIAAGLFVGGTVYGAYEASRRGTRRAAEPVREAADAIRIQNDTQTEILQGLKIAQENTSRSMQELSQRISTMDARQERESSDLYRRVDEMERIQDSHAEALHTLGMKGDALALHVNTLETIVKSRAADKDALNLLASDLAMDPPQPRSKS